MPFRRAIAAGREHLENHERFRFAIDITELQELWDFKPYDPVGVTFNVSLRGRPPGAAWPVEA